MRESTMALSSRFIYDRMSPICSRIPSIAFVAELVFFLFKIGDSMLEPTMRLFIYQSACLERFRGNASACHLPEVDDDVQRASATYMIAYKILVNLPAIALGFFCGAWSDNVGRKLPVVLTLVGTIIVVFIYMISMLVTPYGGGGGFLPLILVGAAIRGAFGRSTVITMALHSYVSDVSSKETRTRRLGGLLGMNFFGYFVGSLLAGALLSFSSFDVVFCLVMFVCALCIIICLLFMKESVQAAHVHSAAKDSTFDSSAKDGERRPSNETSSHPPTIRSIVVDEASPSESATSTVSPFHLRHVRESLNVLVRWRENNARRRILLFFFTILFHQICKAGEVDVTLLFVKRAPLGWSESMYGYMLAADYACLGLVTTFLIPVLIKCCQTEDITLVLVGVFFKVVRLFILSFSNTTWLVYLSLTIGCPSALIVSGAKSILSKTVNEDEIGKIFSLLSAGETVANIIGAVLFTSLYSATFQLFAGLTFCVDAASYLLLLVVLLLAGFDSLYPSTSQHSLFQAIKGKLSYGSVTDPVQPTMKADDEDFGNKSSRTRGIFVPRPSNSCLNLIDDVDDDENDITDDEHENDQVREEPLHKPRLEVKDVDHQLSNFDRHETENGECAFSIAVPQRFQASEEMAKGPDKTANTFMPIYEK